MSDLISRRAALDAIKERADVIDSVFSAFWEGLIIAQGIVANIPSAEPERTARVIDGHCSACTDPVTDYGVPNYCPSCGARLLWDSDD